MVCVYSHFKIDKATEPCFKMIGAGADIYVGDKDKGCSLFPGAFVIAGEEDVSERVARITKIRSFTRLVNVANKNASGYEPILEVVKTIHVRKKLYSPAYTSRYIHLS
jgi:hypothetical protein